MTMRVKPGQAPRHVNEDLQHETRQRNFALKQLHGIRANAATEILLTLKHAKLEVIPEVVALLEEIEVKAMQAIELVKGLKRAKAKEKQPV